MTVLGETLIIIGLATIVAVSYAWFVTSATLSSAYHQEESE